MRLPYKPSRIARAIAAVTLSLSALAIEARAIDAPARAEVARGRVLLGDVLPSASPELAAVDLGPSPALGALRVLTRDDLVLAIHDARLEVPARLPRVVRITRRARALGPAELDRLVRSFAVTPRGVTVAAVRAPRLLSVPDGFDRLRVELPRPPRRSGPFRTTARLDFSQDGETVAQTTVPVELAVSEEAATPDVARSSPLRITVRHGLVEVSVMGMAGSDAFVGDLLPVTLAVGSGRILRARVTGPGEAEVVEAAR